MKETSIQKLIEEAISEASQSQVDDILSVTEMLIFARTDLAKLRKANDPNTIRSIEMKINKSLKILERLL